MSELDQLPPEQRAVLSLILRQRKGYDDVAALLRIDPEEVQARAVAGLTELGPPELSELAPEIRQEVGDYLLSQQTPSESEATKALFRSSGGACQWAREVSEKIQELATEPLPSVPPGRLPPPTTTPPRAASAPPPPAAAGKAPRPPAPPTRAAPGAPAAKGATAPPGPTPATGAPPTAGATPAKGAPPTAGATPAKGPTSAQGATSARRPARPAAATPGRAGADLSGRRVPPGAAAAGAAAATDIDEHREEVTSRRGGYIVLIALAVILAAVIIIIVNGGFGGGSSSSDSGAVSATTSARVTSSTATSTAQPRIEAQINFTPTDSSSHALAVANIIAQGNLKAFALSAQGLAPTSGFAYAVWLYNSESDAKLLGFIDQQVTSNGQAKAIGSLPADAAHYREMVITRETAPRPTQPGPLVLTGQLGSAA